MRHNFVLSSLAVLVAMGLATGLLQATADEDAAEKDGAAPLPEMHAAPPTQKVVEALRLDDEPTQDVLARFSREKDYDVVAVVDLLRSELRTRHLGPDVRTRGSWTRWRRPVNSLDMPQVAAFELFMLRMDPASANLYAPRATSHDELLVMPDTTNLRRRPLQPLSIKKSACFETLRVSKTQWWTVGRGLLRPSETAEFMSGWRRYPMSVGVGRDGVRRAGLGERFDGLAISIQVGNASPKAGTWQANISGSSSWEPQPGVVLRAGRHATQHPALDAWTFRKEEVAVSAVERCWIVRLPHRKGEAETQLLICGRIEPEPSK